MVSHTHAAKHPGRKFALGVLCIALACTALLGCEGATMSEGEMMTQLEASGLHIERLPELTITAKQRARLGTEPETMFSIRVSDESGSTQSMTLIQFDKDWKANAVGEEGVNGFAIKNWFFVGVISQNIRNQIHEALL